MPDVNDVKTEIVRLHRLFEDWFNGTVPDDDDTFAGVRDALADEFVLVSPRADTDGREALLESIRGAHGAHDDMRIWIENVEVRQRVGDVITATYEEWQQQGDDDPRGRISTAVFRRQNQRLVWLHVHETWIAADRTNSAWAIT